MELSSANNILGTRTGKTLANCIFRLIGWSVPDRLPLATKMVIVAAPHTSNWDWVLMLCAAHILGVGEARWLGKHSLFRGLLGTLMYKLGGIPVYREDPAGVVQEMVEVFTQNDKLMLAITPEGTRSYRSHWKSGFYRIAKASGVPIALGYLDYKEKRAGIGPLIWPSENVAEDMGKIREFYSDKHALYSERKGTIRISMEDNR